MDVGEEVESLVEAWRGERPDLDVDSVRIFLPLRRALQAAEARRAEVLARHGVTPAMLDMLVAVRRVGPPYVSNPTDLARQDFVLSAGGVSQRLERLEQAALIERTTSAEDRRGVAVRLTSMGLQALDALMDDYMAHEERLLLGLTVEERTHLGTLLTRLQSSISSS